MNKLLLTSILVWLQLSTHAAVFSLDNSSGAPAAYSVASEALAAMSAGDTLYVQPSPTSYGTFAIDKRIVLLGAGNDPEFSLYRSEFTELAFYNGSDESVVKGIFLNNYLRIPSYQTVANVVIAHNFLSGQNVMGVETWASAPGWIFENNIIASTSNFIALSGFNSGTIFRNNLIFTPAGTAFYQGTSGTVFDHNTFVFVSASITNSVFSGGNNIQFTNNIIYITSPSTGDLANSCGACFWENNLTYSVNTTLNSLPGNNLNNVDPLFVNVPAGSAYFSYSNDYGITELSPAIGAATDQSDIGVTGGLSNFNTGGYDVSLPRLGEVQLLQSFAPANGTITIHVRGYGSGN